MRQAAVVATLLALIPVGSFAGDHWERFRGPNGSGTADDKNVPVHFSAGENLLWKVEVPGVGHGSPVIWGPRLFLQSSSTDGKERLLLCLDANTGKTLWVKSIPGTKAAAHNLNSLATSTPATDG